MDKRVQKPNERKERILTGEVVSTKMKDTIVVKISRYKKAPKYGKFLTRSERFKVHDAGNTAVLGEIVYIKETRPISKDKHLFSLARKLQFRPQILSKSLPKH